MAYIVGFSSGLYGASDAGERESFLTMPRKMFKGSLEGVNFTQIDIESIAELREPYLKDGIRRMRNLGIRIGFHGESYAMGGTEKPIGMLDSCLETEYTHSHIRLIDHVQLCGELNGEFINIHPSETVPFIRLGGHLQPAKLVDPWGRSLRVFLEENPKILEWAGDVIQKEKGIIVATHFANYSNPRFNHKKREFIKKNQREPTEDEESLIEKESYQEGLLDLVSSNDLEYGSEAIAYVIIAKWMQETNDQLWKKIVFGKTNGKKIEDDELMTKNGVWVPAVSAKYIWGHFNPLKDTPFRDPKPLLEQANEKKGTVFVFETQMGGAGWEGLQRLSHPRDMIFLCEAIKSKFVAVCFDFEHVLSQNISPQEEIDSIPDGYGKYVRVCHLGWPTPHPTAHMPIPLGSEGQEYIYERLLQLRKKGMKGIETGDVYFIYERGGADRGSTILAIRMMKKFLEKDTEVKDLPLEFYGMEDNNPDVIRQKVIIREHFFDPLKGMLNFPEEEHTFLGKNAVDKGKGEIWKKEQYR
jgi:hypothetical protein